MIELFLCLLSSISSLLITRHYWSQIRLVQRWTQNQAASDSLPSSSMHPLSVLICVKGNAPYFSRYITKILEQDYPNFEVIVIHSQIPRALLSALDNYVKSNANLRIYSLDENSHPFIEKKQALHYGIQIAAYDWIVTTDDDCYPESNEWLKAINDNIGQTNTDIILGVSPYISHPSWLNRWIRFDWTLGTWNMICQTLSHNPYMGVGRNMAFRKSLWTPDYLDRYGAMGHADDTCLVQYYKDKKIAFMLHPKVYTIPKLSWKDWLIQKNRHLSSGNFMQKNHLMDLAYIPLLSILFWTSIWVWMSYFKMSLMTFSLVIFYLLVKTLALWKIETTVGRKKSIWFTLPIFDFLHSFYLIFAPFFTIFIPKRWKS
jgi:biofilm PGA synthesis N-glycosyltransferase PgaC